VIRREVARSTGEGRERDEAVFQRLEAHAGEVDLHLRISTAFELLAVEAPHHHRRDGSAAPALRRQALAS